MYFLSIRVISLHSWCHFRAGPVWLGLFFSQIAYKKLAANTILFMVDSSAVGGEGSVKHHDAPGRLVLKGQGQEDLRRNSLQSQKREVPKAEPLVVGRLAHENAPLGSPRLE